MSRIAVKRALLLLGMLLCSSLLGGCGGSAAGDQIDVAGLQHELETVIQQHPENTPAHVLLAETYMKLHRSDDARKERQIVNELNAKQQNRQAVAAQ